MILAFTGSREITNKALVREIIEGMPAAWTNDITEIVHGGARVVDRLVHDICEGLWPIRVFPTDWKTHGKKAGPIRNREMAKVADACIAIMIEGGSPGTKDMIKAMGKKPVAVYTIPRARAK